jgi:hypothetical protein
MKPQSSGFKSEDAPLMVRLHTFYVSVTTNNKVVTYELIGRDYSPVHEEVVYDARAHQFYQVILDSALSS